MRTRLRRLPLAVWAIVLVAFLHGLAWAALTPSFQGPDEIAHVGYAQYVAETGKPPKRVAPYAAPAADTAAVLSELPWSVTGRPSWSPAADRALERAITDRAQKGKDHAGELGAAYQGPNPPLYPYLMAVPYHAAGAFGGDILDRIFVMRAATAALGALAVLFVVLLLRELFPRHRMAWYAGGLAVALQPAFGFLIGTVNNDVAVIAAGSAELWLLARVYRRGLSPGLASALGIAVTVGLLSKVSAYGLLAVLGWGLFLLLLRERRQWRRFVPLALLALIVAVVPLLIEQAIRPIEYVTNGPIAATAAGGANGETAPAPPAKGARDFLSYLWQFWLPKAPFMDEQFPAYPHYPVWDTYVQAFAGRFGWFSFGFSPDASRAMTVVLAGLVVGALAAFARFRVALRRNLLLLPLLGGAFVGFAVMVNIKGWQFRNDTGGANFEQVRYLFPMIGLYGVLVAAAVLAFPRRFHRGLVAGVALICTTHVLASWGNVLVHYYT
jgi:4-amino-4-deoxy-L-arabinose transferase-like glycosyltransferase